MKSQWKLPKTEQFWKLLDKYKYVLLILIVGLVLLLWPAEGEEQLRGTLPDSAAQDFDLAALEEKLSQTLSQVEGAGKVTVTLTVKSGMEQVPLTDRSTSVTERGNSVEEKTVLNLYVYDAGYKTKIRNLSCLSGLTKLSTLRVSNTVENIDTSPVDFVPDLTIN